VIVNREPVRSDVDISSVPAGPCDAATLRLRLSDVRRLVSNAVEGIDGLWADSVDYRGFPFGMCLLEASHAIHRADLALSADDDTPI
jgi:hypothetical protein